MPCSIVTRQKIYEAHALKLGFLHLSHQVSGAAPQLSLRNPLNFPQEVVRNIADPMEYFWLEFAVYVFTLFALAGLLTFKSC
jgi:hypothetical protein